jgi:hypothetical protein
VITKPQNVLVMRDIACAGYVAGCNTRWFAKKTGGTYGLDEAAVNMMNRLSFADEMTSKYGSMLAFPCWAGQFESGDLDTVCSITTRLLPWEVTSAGSGSNESFPGGAKAFEQYSSKLNLRSVHFGEDMKAVENQEFISQGSTNNATCFLGPHRRFDPFTKSFMSLVPGQGHFGPDAIPGVRSHPPFSHKTNNRLTILLVSLCSGCPLAPWRVGVAQGGPRRHGRPRARSGMFLSLPPLPLTNRN